MKICTRCKIEKEEIEFFKKRKSLESQCKSCKKEKIKERIAMDPEKHREKQRLRSEERRKTEEWKVWRKDHQKRNRKQISEKTRIYYHENKTTLEKTKIWRQNNKERYNKYIKKNNLKNPLKVKARRMVNYHLNKGNMTRPNQCSECKKNCTLEAHHVDYNKPLDIIWLCRLCHAKQHREKRK